MVGTGITPEGINQNWVVYELMLEAPFRAAPMTDADVVEWIHGYAGRRYGLAGAAPATVPNAMATANAVWSALRASVYGLGCAAPSATAAHTSAECPAQREPELGFHAINRRPFPFLSATPFYDLDRLHQAWAGLVELSGTPKLPGAGTPGSPLLHDLVDVGREALAAVSDMIQHNVTAAIDRADVPAAESALAAMYEVIIDLDRLVATSPAFLLGRWLDDATAQNGTDADKALYQWNARQQITGWSFHGNTTFPGTGDYAAKMWSGLLTGYYLPRWQLFGKMVIAALVSKRQLNVTAYTVAENNLTDTWTHEANRYPSEPSGSAAEVSVELVAKYGHFLSRPVAPPTPPPSPPGPCSMAAPEGFDRHMPGGYWEAGLALRVPAASPKACADACGDSFGRACVGFEVNRPCSTAAHCYCLNSTAGPYIQNLQSFTYLRKK